MTSEMKKDLEEEKKWVMINEDEKEKDDILNRIETLY